MPNKLFTTYPLLGDKATLFLDGKKQIKAKDLEDILSDFKTKITLSNGKTIKAISAPSYPLKDMTDRKEFKCEYDVGELESTTHTTCLLYYSPLEDRFWRLVNIDGMSDDNWDHLDERHYYVCYTLDSVVELKIISSRVAEVNLVKKMKSVMPKDVIEIPLERWGDSMN